MPLLPALLPTSLIARVVAVVLLATLLVPFVLGVATPAASACSLVPPTLVEPADVLADDFNELDSALVQRWIDEGYGSSEPFTIHGAYLVESVLTVEGDGDWTRGSVLAVVQTWGDQPRSTDPWKFDSQQYTDDDVCGPWAGPRLGARHIRLITSPEINNGLLRFNLDRDDEQAAFDAFSEVFGEAVTIEPDVAEEERLLGLLQDQRGSSRPPLPLFYAVGVVAVGGSLFAYRNRDRRARSQSTEPKTPSGSEQGESSAVTF